ncbi:MAG: sulfite oxidase [Pirellulales bacterium]
MKVLTADPPNLEPALEGLVRSWITPVEHFYVRSHAASPELDLSKFRLSVDGLVETPFQLNLEALKTRFKSRDVVATMTCAGNRRVEFNSTREVGGVQWGAGAIGNARWSGVPLAALLKAAGVQSVARHVCFEGADAVAHGQGTIPFGGSIPIDQALAGGDASPGALVCWDMNGKPLTPDHGFPIRMVVPGYIGARSVKWLSKIIVSDQPSANHYLAGAYKLVESDEEDAWSAAPPIYRYPVNSAICVPADGAEVQPGRLQMLGYALPSGEPESTIARVEVSADEGESWHLASLVGPSKPFCWRLWRAEVAVTPRTSRLWVHATDSAGHRQPAEVDWNLKGYLYNAWHRVGIDVRG